MGFNAETAVEPLDYDFTKFQKGVKGTTPEPTDRQIRDFQKAISSINKKYEGMTVEEMAQHVENVTEEEFEGNREASLDAVEIITKGTPTRAQIEELPHRIKQRYYTYLMRELLNPEAPAVGTNS